MKEQTIVKLTAIISLVLLEVVNILTVNLDGTILVTIASIIAGLAGYEFGRRRKE